MDKKAIYMLIIGLVIGGAAVWLVMIFGFGATTQIGKTTPAQLTSTSGLTLVASADTRSLYKDPKTNKMYVQTSSGIFELTNLATMTGSGYGYLQTTSTGGCDVWYEKMSGEDWYTYCYKGTCGGTCSGTGPGIKTCSCDASAK